MSIHGKPGLPPGGGVVERKCSVSITPVDDSQNPDSFSFSVDFEDHPEIAASQPIETLELSRKRSDVSVKRWMIPEFKLRKFIENPAAISFPKFPQLFERVSGELNPPALFWHRQEKLPSSL